MALHRFVLFSIVMLAALDVFPGGGGCCRPSTTAGPCQATCDCNNTLAAPIKCPGEWTCNAAKTCEYQCRETCGPSATDGGCPGSQACNGTLCSERSSCK